MKTAVEWMTEKLFRPMDNPPIENVSDIIEKAKELEKQQAEEIWKASQENMHRQFSSDAYKPITFEQYYTETYETE